MFELLSRATWRDLLDVTLLSVMLSWLFTRLRGGRAVGIGMGLAFLVLVALVAREGGLVLTGWVLQGAIAVLALGAATIFAPEIREALFSANPLRAIVGRSRGARDAALLEPLARAAFEVARQGLGALVVLERRDPVAPHAREGVRLDAVMSEEVLVALFQKTAPTHDGAVLVRRGRIERAGAVLPLSLRDDLPRSYGTRHRAAVGLTEACDAVVLVVSEERGAVSIATQGRVSSPSTPAALVSRLRADLADAGRAGREKKGVLHTWGPRVVVFAAVALVWTGLQSGGVSSISITVPLELQDLPAGTEMVALQPERVRVQVRGAERVLDGVDLASVRVRADLGKVRPGNHEVAIPLSSVELPAGVEALSLDPPRLRFRLEAVEVRELSVVPIIRRDGRRWASRRLSASPPVVRVEGATSRVAGVQVIQTETIEDADLQGGSVRVRLELPGSLRLASGEPDRVTITDPSRASLGDDGR
jgi:uncharacterized protein (TIGR00159 family)